MRKLLTPVLAASLAAAGISVGCDKNRDDDMTGTTASDRDRMNDSTYNRSTGRYDGGTAAGSQYDPSGAARTSGGTLPPGSSTGSPSGARTGSGTSAGYEGSDTGTSGSGTSGSGSSGAGAGAGTNTGTGTGSGGGTSTGSGTSTGGGSSSGTSGGGSGGSGGSGGGR